MKTWNRKHYSHANVVVHVVKVLFFPASCAHRWREERPNLSMCIGRNHMGSSEDGGWVDKTKCIRVVMWYEADTVKPTRLKATRRRCVTAVPAHPENVELLLHVRHGGEGGCEMGMDMEYR